MGNVKKTLSYAAVRRLAPDQIIQRNAVYFMIDEAEAYIRELYEAAIPFMKHRGGTMLMEQDIKAYLDSLKPKSE